MRGKPNRDGAVLLPNRSGASRRGGLHPPKYRDAGTRWTLEWEKVRKSRGAAVADFHRFRMPDIRTGSEDAFEGSKLASAVGGRQAKRRAGALPAPRHLPAW